MKYVAETQINFTEVQKDEAAEAWKLFCEVFVDYLNCTTSRDKKLNNLTGSLDHLHDHRMPESWDLQKAQI